MYARPKLERFGKVQDLTQSGCINAADGLSIPGIGNATGSDPTTDPGSPGTKFVCFTHSS